MKWTAGALVSWLLVWYHRAPRVFAGRFRGEEGASFFQAFLDADWLDRLFFIHLGHLQLATNLSVAAATLVPLEHAPIVTTYLALLLQIFPLLVLLLARQQLGLRGWHIALFGFASMFLASAAEVFANMTNAQSLLSAVTCTLLVLPSAERDNSVGSRATFRKYATRSLLVLAGLSGVPSAFWFPGFAYRAWRERDRERAIQALVLGVCGAVQLSLLAMNGTQRPLSATPLVICGAVVCQLFAAPLLGSHTAQHVADGIKANTGYGQLALMLGFACLSGLTVLCVRSRSALPTALLIGSMFGVTLSVFGSLEPAGLVSGSDGSRYFYAPACGLLLAVVVACNERQTRAHAGLMALLLGTVITFGASSTYHAPCLRKGPAWKEQTRDFDPAVGGTLLIWPPGWALTIPATPGERE